MDLGHWEYDGEFPEDAYGFIYQITNNTNNRKYIGKKQTVKVIKRPPLKGKKNKRHVIQESDWRTYTGSCSELNIDIDELGKENFAFTILKICYNKWELAYEETKLQIQQDVLLLDEYYNGIINCRIGKRPRQRDNNSPNT
tara:strand:+ start:2666 stop:3088 length:423 start_codon:yes stop_codon:yes gene_type:complete